MNSINEKKLIVLQMLKDDTILIEDNLFYELAYAERESFFTNKELSIAKWHYNISKLYFIYDNKNAIKHLNIALEIYKRNRKLYMVDKIWLLYYLINYNSISKFKTTDAIKNALIEYQKIKTELTRREYVNYALINEALPLLTSYLKDNIDILELFYLGIVNHLIEEFNKEANEIVTNILRNDDLPLVKKVLEYKIKYYMDKNIHYSDKPFDIKCLENCTILSNSLKGYIELECLDKLIINQYNNQKYINAFKNSKKLIFHPTVNLNSNEYLNSIILFTRIIDKVVLTKDNLIEEINQALEKNYNDVAAAILLAKKLDIYYEYFNSHDKDEIVNTLQMYSRIISELTDDKLLIENIETNYMISYFKYNILFNKHDEAIKQFCRYYLYLSKVCSKYELERLYEINFDVIKECVPRRQLDLYTSLFKNEYLLSDYEAVSDVYNEDYEEIKKLNIKFENKKKRLYALDTYTYRGNHYLIASLDIEYDCPVSIMIFKLYDDMGVKLKYIDDVKIFTYILNAYIKCEE